MLETADDINLATARTDAEWLARLDEIADERGAFMPLGTHHFGCFVDGDDTLLVTFESVDEIRALQPGHRPLGLQIADRHGWSALMLLARAPRWYRDAEVLDFFDSQIDAGFFESFKRVLFYGAGMGGYAAACFSLAAPGARVLAVAPHATLDPEIAPWETRFHLQRRLDFRTRFGFAPAMLEGVRDAFVVYDPGNDLDAMHATLFRRPFVTMLRSPVLGAEHTAAALHRFGVLDTLIEAAMRGRLTPARFYDLMRKRRTDAGYLRKLAKRAAKADHLALMAIAARHALALEETNGMRKRLERAEKTLADVPD
ncbi:MAG: phosphoadenosine phosphosulfate reductase [Natronohydrobacter sp.]|nr:phosphoadenosine phosphosulfate reductase [Natronohydrobacter sp.]